jgi:hypothetical protein
LESINLFPVWHLVGKNKRRPSLAVLSYIRERDRGRPASLAAASTTNKKLSLSISSLVPLLLTLPLRSSPLLSSPLQGNDPLRNQEWLAR